MTPGKRSFYQRQMVVYWLLFLIFALGAVTRSRPHVIGSPALAPANSPASLSAAAVQWRPPSFRGLTAATFFPIVLIGMRYYVGTDYPTYVIIYKRISHLPFFQAVTQIDVGYALVNWMGGQIGVGLWFPDVICAGLLIYGVTQFAKAQPNPWLVFAIAVPYLMIVVGMGYTRQAVAIGMGFAGLAAINRGSFPKFVAYVLVGALFHRTVVVLIPIVTVAYSKNRVVAITAGVLGSLVGYYVLMTGQGLENLQRIYITDAYLQSQGAGVRLAMNLPPAFFMIFYARRFSQAKEERLTYLVLSVMALLSVVLLWLFPQLSTPIDRMALYIIPLQLFVLARLPNAFPGKDGFASGPATLSVVLYSAMIQFVWLNYAANAKDWVPYHFYPLPFGS